MSSSCTKFTISNTKFRILKKNQEAQVEIEANFQKDSDALEKQITAAEKAANDLEKAQQKETDANGKVFYEVIEPGIYTFYYAEDIKGFDIEMRKGRKGKR